MKKKKMITTVLTLLLMCSVTACGGSNEENTDTQDPSEPVQTEESEKQTSEDGGQDEQDETAPEEGGEEASAEEDKYLYYDYAGVACDNATDKDIPITQFGFSWLTDLTPDELPDAPYYFSYDYEPEEEGPLGDNMTDRKEDILAMPIQLDERMFDKQYASYIALSETVDYEVLGGQNRNVYAIEVRFIPELLAEGDTVADGIAKRAFVLTAYDLENNHRGTGAFGFESSDNGDPFYNKNAGWMFLEAMGTPTGMLTNNENNFIYFWQNEEMIVIERIHPTSESYQDVHIAYNPEGARYVCQQEALYLERGDYGYTTVGTIPW